MSSLGGSTYNKGVAVHNLYFLDVTEGLEEFPQLLLASRPRIALDVNLSLPTHKQLLKRNQIEDCFCRR